MNGLPPLLLLFTIAAFCVGAGVFYSLVARRSLRAALIGWGICGAVVMALGWGAYAAGAAPRLAIFTGLILPVWLMGGLAGLLAGLARRAVGK